MITTTAPITIAGTTREIEIRSYAADWSNGGGTDKLFTAVIGRGAARYPTSLRLFSVAEGTEPHRGNAVTTTADGARLQYHTQTCIRNRQARITGWAADLGVTNAVDQTRS